jgi:hypothetical protein
MEENKFSLCDDDDKFVAVGESKSKNVKHSTKEGKKESSLKIEISKQEKKTKKKRSRKSKNILEQRKVKKVFFNSINKGIIRKEIIKILKEEKTKKLFSTDEQNNTERRKFDSDNIRKKIKSRFLKSLKNAINEKLKSAGSRYIFTLLPQKFVCNLSKKINRDVLNISLKELFSTNFCNIKKEKKADIKKYNHNIFVLKYLENNKDICEKSKFNIIKNMKYTEIFHEYFISKEFEKDISSLIQQKESDKYIKDYIIKARNFINFFAH